VPVRGYDPAALAGRSGLWTAFAAVVILLASAAGCGGSDGDDGDETEQTAKPVTGTFVGKVSKPDTFVSVVAEPASNGQERRPVTVYACDAGRRCELFPGSATGNEFSATAEGGEGQADGKLSRRSASGSIELPGEESASYKADRATAAAGVYNLTVSANGRIRGASAAGVALTGTSTLPEPGSGTLKLADGSRLKFRTTRTSAEIARLEAGQLRLIVLSNGQLRGVGKTRQGADGDQLVFFIRSAAG
jgi:hypothetical protein